VEYEESGTLGLKLLQSLKYPEMVLIECGSFFMGDESKTGESVEKPVHQIILKDFYIAKTETTVLQWKTFCIETKREMPELPDTAPDGFSWKDDHPMVYVSWEDAKSIVIGYVLKQVFSIACLPKPNGNVPHGEENLTNRLNTVAVLNLIWWAGTKKIQPGKSNLLY